MQDFSQSLGGPHHGIYNQYVLIDNNQIIHFSSTIPSTTREMSESFKNLMVLVTSVVVFKGGENNMLGKAGFNPLH